MRGVLHGRVDGRRDGDLPGLVGTALVESHVLDDGRTRIVGQPPRALVVDPAVDAATTRVDEHHALEAKVVCTIACHVRKFSDSCKQ